MAIRKVFTDDELSKELSAYITKENKLFIGIKDEDANYYIVLPESEAIEFIMELYRMKNKVFPKYLSTS